MTVCVIGNFTTTQLIKTESDKILGVALRFDTIAVCIKNKIHTGVFRGRLAVKTAISLLLPAIGYADGNNIPFTKTYLANLHDDILLK